MIEPTDPTPYTVLEVFLVNSPTCMPLSQDSLKATEPLFHVMQKKDRVLAFKHLVQLAACSNLAVVLQRCACYLRLRLVFACSPSLHCDHTGADSCSSRVPLDHYAATGPGLSLETSKIRDRKSSSASLYDTADVISPHLRQLGDSRAASASLPGSQRQSLIAEERFAVNATAPPLQEQVVAQLGESCNSLTAYDISKITHPPPEPYAKSKFRLTSVGAQSSTESNTAVDSYITMAQADENGHGDTPPSTATTSAGSTMNASQQANLELVQTAEGVNGKLPQYTLPDMDIKRQRREVKRQKSLPTPKQESMPATALAAPRQELMPATALAAAPRSSANIVSGVRQPSAAAAAPSIVTSTTQITHFGLASDV